VTVRRVGLRYYYVEANAFPSMFLECDVLDGTRTAGLHGGLGASCSRMSSSRCAASLDKRIEAGTPSRTRGRGSDRFRGQADHAEF
jgi:hypothetical protein